MGWLILWPKVELFKVLTNANNKIGGFIKSKLLAKALHNQDQHCLHHLAIKPKQLAMRGPALNGIYIKGFEVYLLIRLSSHLSGSKTWASGPQYFGSL